MEQVGARFVQQPHAAHTEGFIGPYIHDPNATGRNYRRKSKHARLRARKRAEKRAAANQEETLKRVSQQLLESGYETVGEQTATVSGSKQRGSTQQESVLQQFPSNSPIKRLLKDLQRCDVFIIRSLTALNEHCSDGEKELKRVFALLQQHLKDRELDLTTELHSIRNTAVSILERRRATLAFLKDAACTSHQLDEHQVSELKQQIKQFVAERKVDEEIGSVTRFGGDVDDMLPHIMGFGQVNHVRHLYTEWEENPDKMILRSKSNTTYLPLTPSPPLITETDQCCLSKSDSSTSAPPQGIAQEGEPPQQTTKQSQVNRTDSGVSESSLSGGSGLDDDITSHSSPHASHLYESKHKTRHTHSSHSSKKGTTNVPTKREKETKYSPEQLKAIQARVKDSLRNQGVYLYDPITGAGPPKELEDMGGVADVREGSKEGWDLIRKKKTPTQLRRERKKRQRERERRQRELEKTVSEDSDMQPLTPPPPQSHSTPTLTPPPPPSTPPPIPPPPPSTPPHTPTPPPPPSTPPPTPPSTPPPTPPSTPPPPPPSTPPPTPPPPPSTPPHTPPSTPPHTISTPPQSPDPTHLPLNETLKGVVLADHTPITNSVETLANLASKVLKD